MMKLVKMRNRKDEDEEAKEEGEEEEDQNSIGNMETRNINR